MNDKIQKKSLFTKELMTHMERLTSGKKGVCVTCGIMRDSDYELKMWGSEGEEEYTSHNYEIGSITKTFTGILMSEAVLSGKASPKDRLNKWMIELDENKALADR